MKIPFDIKYRPQIESGKCRVETKAGCPVRIVCWDMACELPILGLVLLNDEKAEEMAVGFTNEGTNLLGEPRYDKLFIVTPEEKMSEFEIAIHRRLNLMNGEYLSATELLEETKGMAAELFELAKDEIYSHESLVEYAETARAEGKAEALKNLPKWKKCQDNDPSACVYNCAKRENSLLYYNGHTLRLIDLEKLPGFKED